MSSISMEDFNQILFEASSDGLLSLDEIKRFKSSAAQNFKDMQLQEFLSLIKRYIKTYSEFKSRSAYYFYLAIQNIHELKTQEVYSFILTHTNSATLVARLATEHVDVDIKCATKRYLELNGSAEELQWITGAIERFKNEPFYLDHLMKKSCS